MGISIDWFIGKSTGTSNLDYPQGPLFFHECFPMLSCRCSQISSIGEPLRCHASGDCSILGSVVVVSSRTEGKESQTVNRVSGDKDYKNTDLSWSMILFFVITIVSIIFNYCFNMFQLSILDNKQYHYYYY